MSDKNEDKSEFIKAEVEKRLVPGIFSVIVVPDGDEYYLVTIADDITSVSFGIYDADPASPIAKRFLDEFVDEIVFMYASERFIRK